jgi:hypothetical protein
MASISLIKCGKNDIRMTGKVYTREWKVKKITFEGEVYSKEECIEKTIDLDDSFQKYMKGDEEHSFMWGSYKVDIFKCLGVPEFKIHFFFDVMNGYFNNSTNAYVDMIIESDNKGLLNFIPKWKRNQSCLYFGKLPFREDEEAIIELHGYGFNNYIFLMLPFTKWISYDISKLIPQTRLQKKTHTLAKYYNFDKQGYFSNPPKEDMSEADKCKVLLEYAQLITENKQKQLTKY